MNIFLSSTFFFSFAAIGTEVSPGCVSPMKMTLENGKEIYFCEFGKWYISAGCTAKGSKCRLIRDLKLRLKDAVVSPSSMNGVGSPGAKICHNLGWKVIMGQMFDGSDVCTCENKNGDSVICTSLLE